ncbi:unnamed protein product [Fusarium venenatum]|uniref:Uncharacterized protein n=1 Tax=Fusarium venenatum TaxID=56646 RepID=A0A2L2TJ18_9HYPO|nr:uncharacterized protein FVRRES_11039 [Fusarium venenatum]CEI70962.1 unnamed protein product [Fusarium venenatum]
MDESGADRRVGYRNKGLAPSGVTPVQVGRFNREQSDASLDALIDLVSNILILVHAPQLETAGPSGRAAER